MHIIHRGIINKKFKENNLNSFKASFKKKFGIETDIHATKDGEFICHHDFTLKRIFNINKSIKKINYRTLRKIVRNNNDIPLLDDVLKSSKNKYRLFIEIKPIFNKNLLVKLINKTTKFKNCVFISFNEKNIFNLLKLKKNISVGLSFSYKANIKNILNRSSNKRVEYLILDKKFLNNKKIGKIRKKKYFYTIKNKRDFLRYSKKNNLIFENL